MSKTSKRGQGCEHRNLHAALAVLLTLGSWPPAQCALAGQAPLCQNALTIHGEVREAGFGYATVRLPDADGDGIDDVAIGAYGDDFVAHDAGRALAFSGATGAQLWSLEGESANDYMGQTMALAGDLNRDGKEDLLISALGYRGGTGRLYVVTAESGIVYRVIDPPPAITSGQWFGESLANIGDINLDGVPDQAVGAQIYDDPVVGNNCGCVYVYSGHDGALLFQVKGENSDDYMGAAVSAARDFNGDGRPEFLASAPNWKPDAHQTGRAYLLSGADASVIQTFEGSGREDQFGIDMACLGDTNYDSIDDFAITGGLATIVYSGADLSILHKFHLGDPGFGGAVSRVGDVNGDLAADILQSNGLDSAHGTFSGKCFVRSGATGSVLFALSGQAALDHFGVGLSSAGDMNRDGLADFWVGAVEQSGTGYVKLFLGAAALPADIDGDGAVTGLDLAHLLADWGVCERCPGDLNQDGQVTTCDLETLFANWTGVR